MIPKLAIAPVTPEALLLPPPPSPLSPCRSQNASALGPDHVSDTSLDIAI